MTTSKTKLTLILLAGLGLALARPAAANPVAPIPRTVQQPDGTALQIIPAGDEFNTFWELPSGYTVVRDATGWWRVAGLDAGGRLQPLQQATAGRVSVQGLASVPRHLRPTKIGRAAGELAPVPAGAREGTVRALLSSTTTVQPVLVILVEFNNQAPVGATPQDFEDAFFGSGRSVAEYYHQATFGKLEMVPAADSDGTPDDGVVGWLKLDMDHPKYGLSGYDQATDEQKTDAENNSQKAIRAAILAADPYVDFSAYDANHDGTIERDELAVVVITAGYEASFGGYSTDYPNANWGHRWSFSGTDEPSNGRTVAPKVDGVKVGDGYTGGGYSTFGEWMQSSRTNGHRSTIGVMVHELGHDTLGLPDLYDTDGSSAGIGGWGLMGSGSWGEDTNTDHWIGATPVLFCAWSRVATAISHPRNLTGNGTVNVGPSYADGAVYRIGSGNPNEYFLAEYRVPAGFDAGLIRYDNNGFANGGGLAVWHVDESVSSNKDDTHRKVDLEEADNQDRLSSNDPKVAKAARSMLYWTGNATVFDDSTTPNAHRYDGSPSGVALQVGDIAADSIPLTFAAPDPVGFPGDLCSTAVDVQLAPDAPYSLAGQSLAQATGGDTPALCAPISSTGWFKVTPQRTGTLSVTTDGSGFDTVAAVLGGSCGSLQVLGCNDDIGGSPHNTGSKVDGIPVQKGVPVYVVIGTYGSGQGGGGDLAGEISLTAAADNLTLTTTQLSGCPRAEWQVTVSDASGPVAGLGAADFAMTADGRDVPVTSVENLGGGSYTIVSYGLIGGTGGAHDLVLRVDSASGSGQAEGSVAEAGTACASAVTAGETLVLPGAAHLAGNNGTNWRTDVFGSVTGGGYALVDATYLPAAGSSSMTPIHRVLAVPEGGGSFGDVAASLFGVGTGKGSVLVRWESMGGGRLALTSRTYNLLGAGNTMGLPAGSTFGQEMPAVPVSGAIPAGGHAWITGLVQEDGVARTNIGLVAAGPSGASVTLEFTGAGGGTILSKQVSLEGYGYQQLDQVMRTVAGGVPAASVKVSVAAGGDPVIAYASVVDGKPTADPVTLLPDAAPAPVWYVPAAAHVTGQADTNWRTDLALFNPGDTAVDVTVDFLQEKRSNASPLQSDAIHLAAGASQRIVNVLPALFGLTGVKGALRVDATGGILVASRTYNQLLAGNAWGLPEGATFGQNVPPLTPQQALTPGQTGVIPGLVRNASFRSNLVLLNTSGVQAQVTVSALAADGSALGAAHTETLLPYEYRQVNDVLLASMGVSGDVDDATLQVQVTGAGASATAFLSVVDERTGDPVSRTAQR